MSEVNKFEFDLDGFGAELARAVEATSIAIQQFADAMIDVFGNLPPFPEELDDMIQQFRIENNLWDDVDFDRLTPEQRWAYQKWVWGAPGRWLREMRED